MVIDNFDRELKQYKEFYDKLREFALHTLAVHNNGDKYLECINNNKYLYFDHVKYCEDNRVIIIWFQYQSEDKFESSNVWINIDKFKKWYLNYDNKITK